MKGNVIIEYEKTILMVSKLITDTKKIAVIFPGQGSQFIGMGKFFYDQFPISKQIFEEASDALNQNMKKLIFDGTEQELTLTHHAQPSIMATSLAMLAALEQKLGKKIYDVATCMAGHSLGEYTALAASGVWRWFDAFQIVKKRGLAMHDPSFDGGMAAVLGLDLETIQQRLPKNCVIANDNAPGQVVISGKRTSVEQACMLLKEAGAKRCVMLLVSAACHSSFMQPAVFIMRDVLDAFPLFELKGRTTSNVTTKDFSNETIKDLLLKQLVMQVRWREQMQDLDHLNGCNDSLITIEIGPGKVLTGLNKRILAKATHYSLQDDFDKILEILNP